MFFDDEDPEFNIHVVRRGFYAIQSNMEVRPFSERSAPTHTEDGIPIRKLYVSNLPPKTTRAELFGVFAQYGFIKSCWLRMGDKGSPRNPTPTYAFVTYSNPADAHKALVAPLYEKVLRGRNLRISPADSWHQPAEDADGRVHWKPRGEHRTGPRNDPDLIQEEEAAEMALESSSCVEEPEESEQMIPEEPQPEPEPEPEPADNEEQSFTILDVLNRDCLTAVLSYIPLRDLIRSERVSKRWQSMVQEYLAGVRTLKTSWWQHGAVTLTTAVLRRVLARVGAALWRLHIDHHWSALNDRTAHTLGKFCPNLEEFKVVGMHTRNWNPLIYGCKQLKILSFVSCNKLTDSSLVQLVKNDSSLESLTVANNTHVTGLFLTGASPPRLHSLAFYNCYSLQGTVLSAAIDSLPNLTTLKLDVCPFAMWKIIPLILNKLPKLEELSLSEYTSVESMVSAQGNDDFCKSLATLTELKVLNLSRNIYISNAIMKQVAQTCTKLRSLNISSCYSRRGYPMSGVGDEGVAAVCGACGELARVDVSYLGDLTDAGVAALARLPRLQQLTARGNPALSADPFLAVLRACSELQELDVCGCDNVCAESVAGAARAAVLRRPRDTPLALRLAGTSTAAEDLPEFPRHKLLLVNVVEDRSNPNLRPDFVDRVFEDSSDDSFDDLYDHENFDDFLNSDDELFLDDELHELDYEPLYAYELHPPDIILL